MEISTLDATEADPFAFGKYLNFSHEENQRNVVPNWRHSSIVPNHSPDGRIQGSYLSLLHVNNAMLHLSRSKCLNRQRGKRNWFPSGSVRKADT
jgi:hypothetical protein